jgi:hypothetical protein
MEKTPFIGQMDRLISIVENVKTRNSTGEEETTEAVVASPYAQMTDVSGNEDIEGKVRHLINRTYIIRYNVTVKEKANSLIVIDDSKKYDVYHIKEIGRKKYLEILVKDYE